MKFDTQEIAHVTAADAAPRLDLYAGIHKALRAMMADVLVSAGRADPQDPVSLLGLAGRVHALLDLCTAHIAHENDFVHTAIEARAPGLSLAVTHDHEDHLAAIAALRSAVSALSTLKGAARAASAQAFYLQLAGFVAHNFEHMAVEEAVHNAALWANYSDAELADIHNALVASIPPAEMMLVARWMIPALNPQERVAVLLDIQQKAPPPAFSAIAEVAREHLPLGEWVPLARALGITPVPGLLTV
jgi:Hemerythrin HHE cation binding domain